MASIFSKFYQYVPPFLRALNLSNQSLAFLQNSKVPIINDHCYVIHTKPPSPPLPLFLSRNQPFSHFLSMATATTTRMPVDEQSHDQPSTSLDACEISEFFEKDIMGNVPIAAIFPSPMSLPSPSLMSLTENAFALTKRKGMEDFILKLEEERRQEVFVLGELHLVSQFPSRGCIQLLIKLRFLRQELTTIIYQQLSENLREKFDAGSHIFLLREHDMKEFPSEESGAVMEIQLFDSYFSVFLLPMDHSNGENNQYFLELISSRELDSLPQAFCSLQILFSQSFGHKDQQKRRSSEALWDGRSLWWSYLDWRKHLYCHMMQIWHNEAVSKRKKMSLRKQYIASIKHNWLLHPSNLRKGCG